MTASAPTCHLVCDFTAENFAAYLRKGVDPGLDVSIAPFGQAPQELARLAATSHPYDFVVLWTLPERAVPSFGDLLRFERLGDEALRAILAEVDRFTSAIVAAQNQATQILVPTWLVTSQHVTAGSLGMRTGLGASNALLRMNLRLIDNLEGVPGVRVLDAQKWLLAEGESRWTPKLWYAAKVPFSNAVYREAAADVHAAIQASTGRARKLIVLDLDDTLWGGLVGEVGWEHVRLGGHDYIGEAFADFQLALKTLANRGILLAVVSKNEEAVALDAIDNHPAMVLKTADLAGWRINWMDKAENVRALIAELNLGLDAAVFIDDSPAERARVREALPDVLVPEWPTDPAEFAAALRRLPCFDATAVTHEDLARTRSYVSQREHRALQSSVGSLDEWLKTLDIHVTAERLSEKTLARAAQLLNKTNQMNLSTRRMSEQELLAESRTGSTDVWVFSLTDRLGDAGLIGVASLHQADGELGRIRDFILSCRVLGRKVEQAMIHRIVEEARRRGLRRIVAEYLPTAKNKPCLRFFEDESGFEREREQLFFWPVAREYVLPDYVAVRVSEHAAGASEIRS